MASFVGYFVSLGFLALFVFYDGGVYIACFFVSLFLDDVVLCFALLCIFSFRLLFPLMIDTFGQEIVYSDLAVVFGFVSLRIVSLFFFFLVFSFFLLVIRVFSFRREVLIGNERFYVFDAAFISSSDDFMDGHNIVWEFSYFTYVYFLRCIDPFFFYVFYFGEYCGFFFVVCAGGYVGDFFQVFVSISFVEAYLRYFSAFFDAAFFLLFPTFVVVFISVFRVIEEIHFTVHVLLIMDLLLFFFFGFGVTDCIDFSFFFCFSLITICYCVFRFFCRSAGGRVVLVVYVMQLGRW
ncbi:hypothetical protein [Bacteroides graminisolvens]|uniref:hypothetical protein n=1 Tax=Bacteroides graminisolvens TaxID=477666 RepID=UPI0012B58490|nr:hypothetical protein [Bacteroides graminisolvens]